MPRRPSVSTKRLRKRSMSMDSYLDFIKPNVAHGVSTNTLDVLAIESNDGDERQDGDSDSKILPPQRSRKTGITGKVPQMCTDLARFVNTKMSMKRNMLSERDPKPLIIAIRHGDINRVRYILESPQVYINGHDSKGVTAVHEAAIAGESEILKLLLHYNAQVNISDNDGYTCLDYAVFGGNFECARFLIDHGATDKSVRDGMPYYFGKNKFT